MTREQIQEAITALSADERGRLRAWLERYEETQIAAAEGSESAAEKYGRIAGRAFSDIRKRMRDT